MGESVSIGTDRVAVRLVTLCCPYCRVCGELTWSYGPAAAGFMGHGGEAVPTGALAGSAQWDHWTFNR